jgi:hypothetical protein
MSNSTRLHLFIRGLVGEAESVVSTVKHTESGSWSQSRADLESFAKLRAKCSLLSSMLPQHSNPWRDQLESEMSSLGSNAVKTLAALKAIQEVVDAGFLFRLEDFVFAEAFSDLLDQADYLNEQGYVLAAGVLGRAVLEERLKRLCVANGCSPDKTRPTINDFNTQLYTTTVYDKSMFKHVDAIAAVGNDAAHGETVEKPDIERLLRDVRDFLTRFSA